MCCYQELYALKIGMNTISHRVFSPKSISSKFWKGSLFAYICKVGLLPFLNQIKQIMKLTYHSTLIHMQTLFPG